MKLPGNEVHLHYLRPEALNDASLLGRYETLLTDGERRQISRFHFTRHKQQYLLTRALLRTSLSRYRAVDPADWVFGKNAYGKPCVHGPEAGSPIHFNISHADGMIICALSSRYEVGADVEDSQRSTRAAFKRLSGYFSAMEARALDQLPERLQKARFFDYWTLKEAYIKARGAGLAIPLRKFGFGFSDDRLTQFHVDDELGDTAAHWTFWRMSMPAHYRLAVALRTSGAAVNLSVFRSIPLGDIEQRTPDVELFRPSDHPDRKT